MEDLPQLEGKEIGGKHGTAQEHVIVEVDEVVGEALDVVQVEFDGGRGKGGKRRVIAEDLLVRHDLDALVRGVKPVRDLSVRHQIHLPNPGGVRLKGAQTVSTGIDGKNDYFNSSLSRKRFEDVAVSPSSSSVKLCSLLYRPLYSIISLSQMGSLPFTHVYTASIWG